MLLFRNIHGFPHILTTGTLPHGNMDWLWKHMLLNDTLKAFDDFKSKQNKAWSNVLWYVKVYMFWKFVQYTIHLAKAKMLKKLLPIKSTLQKMYSFYFRELQHITVFLLIHNSYMSWGLVSVKACAGFSIFDSFLFEFIFFFKKKHGVFDYETP